MVVVLQELDNYIILISRPFAMYYVYLFLSSICFFVSFLPFFHFIPLVYLAYFNFILIFL
jgi:hypothetical protein